VVNFVWEREKMSNFTKLSFINGMGQKLKELKRIERRE
jgi:hypothetical protein